MKHRVIPAAMVMLMLGVAGCTTIPTGPSRMALPGTGKDFNSFRVDDSSCRQYALDTSGATPSQTQENSAVKSAVVGTAIGAAAGAAIGGSSHGAAAGAGVGLLMGALAGTAASDQSGFAVQRRYDNSYVQCMYAKGHRVPVPAGVAQSRHVQAHPTTPQQPYYAPPSAPSYYPAPQQPNYYGAPPPPGSAPPPPSAIVR